MVTDTQQPVNRRSREFAKVVADITREMANDPSHGTVWQPKLQDAADLVFASAVDFSTDPVTVRSGAHAYQIDATYGCTCLDARHRNRYCKHWLAMEMEKRIQGETDMPRKSTPQDEWEAKVATGPEVDDLFGDPKENPDEALEAIEPDDIPEPEAPIAYNPQTREPIYQMKDDMVIATTPTHVEEQLVSVSGHQYTDYPSTLCIKRRIGEAELSWTLRGTDHMDVWKDAWRVLDVLKKAADHFMPPPPPVPTQPSAEAPAPPPPPQTDGERAVNHGLEQGAPWCATHQCYYERWTKGQRQWYAHKVATGGFCNPPRS
jgi:hypothetical protein